MTLLQRDSVALRPLQVADAIPMYVPFCDPALYFFVPMDPPATLGAMQARFEELCSGGSEDGLETWQNWTIRLEGHDTPIGIVETTLFRDARAQIGYFVFRDYWRRGIASIAVGLAVEHLREACAVRLCEAFVDTRNFASMRVLEKLGFTVAEFIPQADFFKGQHSDEYRLVNVMG